MGNYDRLEIQLFYNDASILDNGPQEFLEILEKGYGL